MINEFEFYHGVVFAGLVHGAQREFSIKSFPSPDNASYVIDGKIGIYIKYSKKRLSPWRFSFQKRHQEEMQKMKESLNSVFLLLVCHEDGVVVLDYKEVKHLLDEAHEEVEWISAARNRRQMYAIKGSDGHLSFKIGKDEFPHKIFGTSDVQSVYSRLPKAIDTLVSLVQGSDRAAPRS